MPVSDGPGRYLGSLRHVRARFIGERWGQRQILVYFHSQISDFELL